MPSYLEKMMKNEEMIFESGTSKNDELLFNPYEDEQNQKWAQNNCSSNCISCSKCFTAVSYEAEQENQKFKCKQVLNIEIDENKIVETK